MDETHNPLWAAISGLSSAVRAGAQPAAPDAVADGGDRGGGASLFPRLGGEFLPKLEEGNSGARDHAADDLAASMARSSPTACAQRSCVSRSRDVVSQVGRPDDGTETTGFFNIEFFGRSQARLALAARADQAANWSADRREA